MIFIILAKHSQYDVFHFNAIIEEKQQEKEKKMIVFQKLWGTMKEKGVSQYKLIHEYKISESQLTRLRKNEIVKTEILSKLCGILDCNIEDICTFQKD